MAPLGFAAYSNEVSLKKGNNYILDHLKRGWMLTVYLEFVESSCPLNNRNSIA